MSYKISIARTSSENKDFHNLIVQLDKELLDQYNDAQSEVDVHNIVGLLNTVIIAYYDNIPVGCGCFKIYNDNSVEIKRIFVKPEYRGRGISKSILVELENWAMELGFGKAILETGYLQTAAIGLYSNTGYVRTENYGPYKKIPISVCFEKILLS